MQPVMPTDASAQTSWSHSMEKSTSEEVLNMKNGKEGLEVKLNSSRLSQSTSFDDFSKMPSSQILFKSDGRKGDGIEDTFAVRTFSKDDIDAETMRNNKNGASLSTALEKIPLSYCPITKRLQIVKQPMQIMSTSTASSTEKVGERPEESCSQCSSAECSAADSEHSDTKLCATAETEKSGTKTSMTAIQSLTRVPSFSYTECSSFCGSLSSLSTNYSEDVLSSGCLSVEGCDSGRSSLQRNVNIQKEQHNNLLDPHSTQQQGGTGGVKAKRRGITNFIPRGLFSRSSKSKDPAPSTSSAADSTQRDTSSILATPPWRLFSRVPQIPSITTNPTPNRAEDISGRTALILQNRPADLPAKSQEDEERHKAEYEAMLEASRKKEAKESKLRKKRLQQQIKQEDFLANSLKFWNEEALPNWDRMKGSRKTKDLWWHGIPPSVRGKVWKFSIGNNLNLTSELYEICKCRAGERIKMATNGGGDGHSSKDSNENSAQVDVPESKESSVEVIKLDVSRTFPQLCIFQKGGPYYDYLHDLLGAYACYRPDVGYVQGMSFLAAVLLLNMECVEDAFICFANLLNKPCQLSFFRINQPAIKAYFLAYEQFFDANLPKLSEHFKRLDMTPDLYLIDWVYTMFAKSLPLDVACHVWDVYCRDGEEFLFRTALGILRLYKDELLALDFTHAAEFLTKIPEIQSIALFKSIDHIHMHLDKLRFGQVMASHRNALKNKETTYQAANMP